MVLHRVCTNYRGVAVGEGVLGALPDNSDYGGDYRQIQGESIVGSQYDGDEEMRKTRYHDMLREDIREFVTFLGCKTLNDMIEKALKREIELEL